MKKILLLLVVMVAGYNMASAQITIFEDFDSYTVGEDIVDANPTYFEYWPGGNLGLNISDVHAASGANSVYLFSDSGGGPADVIMNFQDKYDTGTARLSFKMFVSPDHGAYFNVQAEREAGQIWASNVTFFQNGTVEFSNSDNTVAASAIYPQGEWFEISYKVNLDANVWELSMNGKCLTSYANPANSFASMNLYPYSGSGNAEFWFDDILFEHSPEAEIVANDAALSLGSDPLAGLEGATLTNVGALTNNLGDVINTAVLEFEYNGTETTINLEDLNLAEGESVEINLDSPITLAEGLTELTLRLKEVNGVAGDDVDCNNTLYAVTEAIRPTPRKGVLAEEATGTWCPQCPRGAVAMESMKEKYGDYFVGVAVHNDDPMAITDYDAGMATINGFSGYPNVSIDRGTAFIPSNSVSSVENPFLAQLVAPIKSAFLIGADLDGTTNELDISVQVEAIAELTFVNQLVVAIVEDHVTGTGDGYAQSNALSGGTAQVGNYANLPDPVPADQMVYDDVARALLTPFDGMSMDLFTGALRPGDTKNFSFNTTLDADWDKGNLFIVAFVLNPNGSVDNAIEVSLRDAVANGLVDTNDPALQASFEVFPNPAAELMNVKLESPEAGDVSLELINMYGQVVKTDVLKSFVGKQNWLVNISDLHNGMYVARVTIGNKTAVQSVQKFAR